MYVHPEPRRIRGTLEGTTVLARTDTETHCPFKGYASYYDLHHHHC
ncbi:MAG: DUF427 domain-containing protein [Mycobacteriaceae bacterium]